MHSINTVIIFAGAGTGAIVLIIVMTIIGVAKWKKRSINIYEIPYNYAVPPLPPRNTFCRIDHESLTGIYDMILEDYKDVSLQQADAHSQNKSPDAAISVDVVTDSKDVKLNNVEFSEGHTGEQHNAA